MDLALYHDLESYHAWAMGKLFGLCHPLTDDALDASLPLGMGTLRATLQHIAAAEQIWLDRWVGKSTTGLPMMPTALSELESNFALLARDRKSLFEGDSKVFRASVKYKSLDGKSHENNLGSLAIHVLNHAIHHRAQALYFLKKQGLTIPGGLDYIFYRIAVPTVLLKSPAAAGCRHWGLEVGEVAKPYSSPDLDSLIRYGEYGDWAMQSVFEQVADLSDEQLDTEHGMGVGAIRKTLLHLLDAECFWQANWKDPGSPFPSTSKTTTINELASLWSSTTSSKRAWLEQAGQSKLGDIVRVDFGSGPLEFRLSESVIQLAVHGTLHRSQVTNMIRTAGKKPKSLDYVTWLRTL